MEITLKGITNPLNTKEGITYPVFAKYTDGDVYLFTSKSSAIIIKHSDPDEVGTVVTDVMEIYDDRWVILPDGYTVELTQRQGN